MSEGEDEKGHGLLKGKEDVKGHGLLKGEDEQGLGCLKGEDEQGLVYLKREGEHTEQGHGCLKNCLGTSKGKVIRIMNIPREKLRRGQAIPR
jgi:hypothetical protein